MARPLVQKVHRLLVLAAPGWNDYDYRKSEFLRLGSIHKTIKVIYPDDVEPWMLHIRDWCKQNPEKFIAAGYQKNVFDHGHELDEQRDWRMFWDGDPDEVWLIECSAGWGHKPDAPVWPHLWDAAMAMNMQCVRHRAPHKGRKIKDVRRQRKAKSPRWTGHNRWTGD